MEAAMGTRYIPRQIWAATGIDQICIYGNKYWAPAGGLLLVWGWLAVTAFRGSGARDVLSNLPFQVCILTAAGILIMPGRVGIPGYNHPLVFLAERMSLALGICICGLVAAAVRPYQRYAIAVLALVFFGFVYADERVLNGLEERMQSLVSQLPPGQRVISALDDPDLRTNPLTHMIDRACLAHCWAYGNYEPSSAQFRIRVTGPSPLVMTSDLAVGQLGMGTYVVEDRDLPLYQVVSDPRGRMAIRSLAAGTPTGITPWTGL
jgi:hypothetical protein